MIPSSLAKRNANSVGADFDKTTPHLILATFNKTSEEIRPLKTMKELKTLDDVVNEFIAQNGVRKVISVSDSPITDDKGETIGLVRVVAYED